MSGLEIVAFLLGTTGPLQQSIEIVQAIHKTCKNYKKNADTIQNIIEKFLQNQEQIEKLQTRINQCQSHLSQNGIDGFNNTMKEVKENIERACRELNEIQIMAEKKGWKAFLKANKFARQCEELLQLLQNNNQLLLQFNNSITGYELNISVAKEQTKELIMQFKLSAIAQTLMGNIRTSGTAAQTDANQPNSPNPMHKLDWRKFSFGITFVFIAVFLSFLAVSKSLAIVEQYWGIRVSRLKNSFQLLVQFRNSPWISGKQPDQGIRRNLINTLRHFCNCECRFSVCREVRCVCF